MFLLTLASTGIILYICCRVFEGQTLQGTTRAFKRCIGVAYLWYLKRKCRRLFQYSAESKDIYKTGIASTEEEWFYESPRPLKSNVQAEDAIEFFGVDNNGNSLILHLARRPDRTVETWVHLKRRSGDEYQSLIHPDTTILNTDGKSFSAGGLTLEVLDPLRSWRVIFRGMLRKGVQNDWGGSNNEEVKVCFNFIWRSAYHHFVLSQDYNTCAMAEAISKMPWSSTCCRNFKVSSDDRHEQWGRLVGTIQIENDEEEQSSLWATKIRSHGVRDVTKLGKKLRIHLHTKEGAVLSLQANEVFEGINNATHGYMIPSSNFDFETFSQTDLNVNDVFRKNGYPEEIAFNFTANGNECFLKLCLTNVGFRVFRGNDWDTEIMTRLATGYLGDDEVTGIVEFSNPYHGKCPIQERKSLPLLKEMDSSHCQKIVVRLLDSECCSSQLVGGKGASLALMMTIRNFDEKFDVPNGICLTKNAFSEFLHQHAEIQERITKLENVAWKISEGCLKTHCQIVVDAFENSMLSNDAKEAIHEQLLAVFGEKYESIQFAVRSSAIGEDGEEISAAGQNETYLGTKGLLEIYNAIMKCWASQFAFRSVEYKRQNGQLLNAGMGVVIQEMIPSDVSGVMFCGDPLTGAFGFVTITANYGLGESVVSGLSDPDTIILQRSWNDKLSIDQKQIGKKKLKIILKTEGGTEEQETDAKDADLCTMSDDLAMKLAKVAIFLEKCYGGPRDLEWAICNGRINLLQCRPITTYLQESRYEILHEFDTPQITENGRFTRANVGEVMPGASSPLTLSATSRAFGLLTDKMSSWTYMTLKYNPISMVVFGMPIYCNNWMADRIDQKKYSLSEKLDAFGKATMLGIHGRIIDDGDVAKVALKRYPKASAFSKLKSFYVMFLRNIIMGSRILKQWKEKYENYEIPIQETETAEQVYQQISDAMFVTADGMIMHVMVTCPSMIWNLIILNILAGGKDYTLDQYHDFANLIGKGNGAISGDVPFSLKELSQYIVREISHEEFSKMAPEKALDWLKTGTTDACIKFQDFLKRHGHRSYQEMELSSLVWAIAPIKLVKVLQTMTSTGLQAVAVEQEETIAETIAKLKTPLSYMKKWLLAYVVSFVRRAVMNREQAKSLAVKTVHGLRMAYLKLGEMLVNEGRIPDTRLIFFLTHDEIGRLIKTRSARILNRAFHRQRLYPHMNSLHFAEFIVGEPKAIEEQEEDNAETKEEFKNTTILHGYPVSQGAVNGPARVIFNFNEVDQIQHGDILITQCTDIGWSPYFPMLAGVVTEIGGLVSHGAVVAREYGLPCIVAAIGATKIFKSGDIVYLNASKGTIEKVSA